MPLKESKGELRDLLPTNTVTPLAFTNMFQHLEWRSLQDRRKDSRLNMFYKIVNNKVEIQKQTDSFHKKGRHNIPTLKASKYHR
jgi:hypothetical protein